MLRAASRRAPAPTDVAGTRAAHRLLRRRQAQVAGRVPALLLRAPAGDRLPLIPRHVDVARLGDRDEAAVASECPLGSAGRMLAHVLDDEDLVKDGLVVPA